MIGWWCVAGTLATCVLHRCEPACQHTSQQGACVTKQLPSATKLLHLLVHFWQHSARALGCTHLKLPRKQPNRGRGAAVHCVLL